MHSGGESGPTLYLLSSLSLVVLLSCGPAFSFPQAVSTTRTGSGKGRMMVRRLIMNRCRGSAFAVHAHSGRSANSSRLGTGLRRRKRTAMSTDMRSFSSPPHAGSSANSGDNGAAETTTSAAFGGMESWQKGRVSIALRPNDEGEAGDSTTGREITRPLLNSLAPLLEGVGAGVALLQPLGKGVDLWMSSPERPSPSLTLCIGKGNVVLGPDQQIGLSWTTTTDHDALVPEGDGARAREREEAARGGRESGREGYAREGGGGGAAALGAAAESSGHAWKAQAGGGLGSLTFDFLLTWSGSSSTADAPPASRNDEDGPHSSATVPGAMGEHKLKEGREGEANAAAAAATTAAAAGAGADGVTAAAGSGSGSGGNGRERSGGPQGGSTNSHVVGGPRPSHALSVERQAVLEAQLQTLGIDTQELCHSDEFFGTSALKTFNTFVRPRAKKIDKVFAEPVEKAAVRTAQQIAFLIRRHNADRAESLRNKDRALESALERKWKPFPITVVADNIRSAYNVGSLFRTADTAGVAEVVTTGLSPHPNGHGDKKLRKTAFSALDTVPSRHFESTADAICKLRAEGCAVYCLETTTTAVNLFELELPRDRPVAMVFGNEVTGVDQKVLELCDAVVEVPVFGVKNSLNVASVAAVVVYEIIRKWAGGKGAKVAAQEEEEEKK